MQFVYLFWIIDGDVVFHLIYLAQYQGTAPISVYMGLLNISKTI
jgi:hypothetical protein